MVKQRSDVRNDHHLNEYKMHTSNSVSRSNHQQNSSKNSRVPVAHSSGCCCSKRTNNNPPPSPPVSLQSQTPNLTAHEKSHIKLDPFYQRHEKVNKKTNRTKHSNQQQNVKNKNHSNMRTTYNRQPNKNFKPVNAIVPTTKKQSSCCTIL